MARTKNEIFEDLMTRKDADEVLSLILTSNSKASFYQSLFALYADVTGDFELTFDDFKEEIDALLESKQVHTSSWWRRVSLEFQLGDQLIVNDNGNLGYDVEDTEKQIIQRAAIITTDAGAIRLKVAKLSSDDITPIPLSSSENSAFSQYVRDVGPAGIAVNIVSVNGDEIKIALDVLVDSQVINITDGTLLSDDVTKPVEDAIYEYFETFQADDFGGTFYANKLMQTILSAEGVENATFNLLTKKGNDDTVFEDVLALSGKKFLTFAGYVRLADDYELSDNITYSAE